MSDDSGTPVLEDAEIALLMMQGDEEGLRELLGVHGPRVRGFLRARFGEELADAAFWEAAQKAWESACQYDERQGTLGAWFLAIAHNCARDIVASRPRRLRLQRTVATPYEAPDARGPAGTSPGRLSRKQRRRIRALRLVVRSLPRAQRRIIEADLARDGSASAAELVRELGLTSAASVRAQRSKAKAAIVRELVRLGLVDREEETNG